MPRVSCSLNTASNLNTSINEETLQKIYNGESYDLFTLTHMSLHCSNQTSMAASNKVAVYLSGATGADKDAQRDGYNVPILKDSLGHNIVQEPFVYGVYNKDGVVQIATSKAPIKFTGHLCDINPLNLSSQGVAPVQQCPFSIKLLKNPAATAADEAAIKNISTISGTLNFKVEIE